MNDPAVELLGVSKWFGGEQNPDDRVVAVNSIDLTLRRGEFFTLLGPSGCGKTTTLRIVAGFEDPSEGQLMIQGKPMNDVPANRRPVNMVFQNYALFPHLSVVDNVGFGLAVKRVPAAERSRLVAEAMALVQLDGYEKRRPLSSPAASNSESPWPVPSSTDPPCCCSTSRWGRWTSNYAKRCSSN